MEGWNKKSLEQLQSDIHLFFTAEMSGRGWPSAQEVPIILKYIISVCLYEQF